MESWAAVKADNIRLYGACGFDIGADIIGLAVLKP